MTETANNLPMYVSSYSQEKAKEAQETQDTQPPKKTELLGSSIWVILLHVLFVLLIAGSVLVQFNKLNSIAVLNDEFGYWGIAASLAGFDWTPLLSQTPFYSGGYSWILALIMGCGNNPVIWYRIAIVLNIILLIGCYFLAYLMLRDLHKLSKKLSCEPWLAAVIAGLSVILPSNIAYGQVAWSETVLIFLTWLCTYLFVKNQIQFSWWKTGLILLVLAYSFAVHARALPMLLFGIVICVIQIFQNLEGKKKWIALLMIVLAAVLGYLAVDLSNELNLHSLWANSASSSINSTSADSVASGFFAVLIHHPGQFLLSLTGKLDYAILATQFLFLIPGFRMVNRIYRYFRTGHAFPEFSVYFWIVCLPLGMILLTAFQMSDWQSRQDIEVYSRYFEFSLGPLIALGWLVASKRTKDKVNLSALITSFAFFGCSLYFVYRAVRFSDAGFTTICAPVIGGYIERFTDIKTAFFVIGAYTAVIAMFWVIFFVLVKKKARRICYLCLATFVLITSMITGWDASQFVLRARAGQDAASEAALEALPELTEDTKLIYIPNAELDPLSVPPKYIQFNIPDHTITLLPSGSDALPPKAENSDDNKYYLIWKIDEDSEKKLEEKGYQLIESDEAAYIKIYH